MLPFAKTADTVLTEFGGTLRGLTESEAGRRLVESGPNTIPEAPLPGPATVFARQFASPFIYVLLVAGGLSLILREWSNAIFIGAVVVLNAAIGAFQEYRAERSALALRQMITTTARVVRDGDVTEVEATAIVPGDLVLLASGDKVPADLRLLSCHDLHVDESLLTGESLPVHKDAECVLDPDTGLGERLNMAFAGSLVSRGRGQGVTVATGPRTEIGALASELSGPDRQDPPLLIRMRRFTHRVSAVMIIVAAAFVILEAARGKPLSDVALVAIALVVSAIPEGLPIALTVALAIAMRRMASRNVIVRRMAAVEALGSCTTIATDKTGTLTVNELTVTDVVLPGGSRWSVSGAGVQPIGDVVPLVASDASRHEQVAVLARTGVLCNEGVLAHEEATWIPSGDAVDVSLLVLAHKLTITRPSAIAAAEQLAEIPYESERRYAASLNRAGGPDSAGAQILVKGAVETVLGMCTHQLGPSGDEPLEPAEALALSEQLAHEGRRVIALAERFVPDGASEHRLDESHLHDLVLLGLVGLLDPPRPGVNATIAECRSAGLRVVMVTGDHPATALAVAHEIGLTSDPEQVVTGHDLRQVESSEALDDLVANAMVFARVEPAQKLDIVASLVRRGELVAVTGDGANDAPALRRAHVGVAMGASGTDVAREAADLIVSDDNLSSVVAGIEEGRVGYANIRKVISLLISTGAAELVLFLLALSTGMNAPLTAVQLLWLNLVTNGIQDVALAFEPPEGNEMQRPPRPPSEGVFNSLMLRRISVSALVIGSASFLMFRLLIDSGWSLHASRNAVVFLMVLFENVMVLNSRSETESLARTGLRGNRLLVIGTFGALGIHIAAMQWGPTQSLLNIAPLPPYAWAWAVLIAVFFLLPVELDKLIWRHWHPSPPPLSPRPEHSGGTSHAG